MNDLDKTKTNRNRMSRVTTSKIFYYTESNLTHD